MKFNNLKISIIIIGYNTAKELAVLLNSINNLEDQKHLWEIIYIDDGSKDESYHVFKTFNSPCAKLGKQLPTNSGRTFATQEGINLASGSWYLFIRSNEIVSTDLIVQFKKTMKKTRAYAYMGAVHYSSKNKTFLNYLNNPRRGIKLCDAGEKIHYKFLLFNNSLIIGRLFNQIKLNLDLTHYGGEELDFSSKLNKIYPNMICASPNAIVFRKNHPDLSSHCVRLEEFGCKNFKKLTVNLQLDIVNYRFLLKKTLFLHCAVLALYVVCDFLNSKISNQNFYWLVRIQLLCAILKGYYKLS